MCQRVIAFTGENLLKVPKPDNFKQEDLNILKKYSNNYNNIIEYINNQNINLYMNL